MSMGEVLPGLWVGNFVSVSEILNQSYERSDNKTLHLTIISVLSNSNLIHFVKGILEQHRLEQSTDSNQTIRVRHDILELKDSTEADLLSVLPNALTLIDDALAYQTTSSRDIDDSNCHTTATTISHNSDSRNNIVDQQRICLIHCARGASRSVSIVIAYLLSRHKSIFKSFDEALQQVRKVRPVAMPNIGFSLALKRFEKTSREEI